MTGSERGYPHRPDTRMLRRRLDRAPGGVGLVETTLGDGRGHLGIVDAGIDDVWESVATRWLFGGSVDEALELVPRGCALVRTGLDRFPGPVRSGAAGRWLGLPGLVGDEVLTRAVVERFLAPGALSEGRVVQPQEVTEFQVLAALRVGLDEQAREGLAALRTLGPREVPPVLVDADRARADLAEAVLAANQAGLDAAAAAYSTAWLRFGGRSQSNRASWHFLLDVPGLVLMAAAVRRGLVATPGVPVIPAELVT